MSIRRYCPTTYCVKILSQGPPDNELLEFLRTLNDNRFELITSPVNLGHAGGRRLLAELVVSPFTMMLDDDMYLTEGSVQIALRVLEENPRIGAVNMPMFDIAGDMLGQGGRNMTIQLGVIHRRHVRLDVEADWIEANDLSEGGMLYRTKMRRSFSWDPKVGYFEGLDKSLQLLKSGWKQAILPRGRLIHDRSWISHGTTWLDGLFMRRSYRYVRTKWRMRFDMKTHILFELLYPCLTLTRCKWLFSIFSWFLQLRTIRGNLKFSGGSVS